MFIIAWLILGLISGFIASKIVNNTGEGLIPDLVLGIVGAVISGLVFTHFFSIAGVTNFDLNSMFVAVAGAVLLLLVFRQVAIRRRA